MKVGRLKAELEHFEDDAIVVLGGDEDKVLDEIDDDTDSETGDMLAVFMFARDET